ncbi:protein tweety isoform X2 [Macrosteles quadrilineatus]|uniref:protein tweety isoform X2 n=1 Tax=Macrosteles quadrilineatus TaxID=74068 RepID=UPI0023E10BF5|nr:protein tweety isoform X2 [Macrosteles quadrilineatus]
MAPHTGLDPPNYTAPPLAKFFHTLPHLNISLHLVNSTFAPDSEIYLESLGILGSIPAAWLILTLFLLLVYLLTRCCDRKPRPKHSIQILKWTLSFFTILCCGAVGVGLYGNDDVHNGMLELLSAARAIDDIIGNVKNQTGAIESTLKLKVTPLLTELGDVFDDPVANQTARAMLLAALTAMTGNTTAALASLQDIMRPLRGVSLGHAVTTVHVAEAIRWPVTMAVLSVLLVFCVVLLVGVARHSRCALITFSVFGLFAVIISWLLASVYLTASVALGDLCDSPHIFLEHSSPSSLQQDILEYYTSCEPARTNPFSVVVRKGTLAVDAVFYSLSSVARLAKQLYSPTQLHPQLEVLTTEVNLALKLISGLAALLDCRPIHREYMHALHAVCDLGLFGLTFMLAASAGAGFFFTILVWLDSHTWIYIRKKRDYLQVDEQDPFLPPTAASQAIAARTLRNQGDGRGVGLSATSLGARSFGDRGSPYEPGQYATLNRKFRTLDHPSVRLQHQSMGGRRGTHLEPGNSHTLGNKKLRSGDGRLGDGPGQYSTLSKKCKTLESSDFY